MPMKRLLLALAIGWLGLGTLASAAAAQDGRGLFELLDRLQRDQRYEGQVLGTHAVERGGRTLYEVRILTRDDRVVLVYIDPETGAIVGDTRGR